MLPVEPSVFKNMIGITKEDLIEADLAGFVFATPTGTISSKKLIKNIHVYSPEDMGVKDVLIAANKICRISDEIKIASSNKALQKKAPFHNSKNNMAHSLLIETFFNILDESTKRIL